MDHITKSSDVFLKFCNRYMGRVRAAGFSVLDSFVVEVENILSVSFKRSDRSEFLRIVFSPKAVLPKDRLRIK